MERNTKVIEQMLNKSAEKWSSAFIARVEVPKFTGGMISANTMRNRDSLGTGPDGKFQLGKKVGYPIQNLINWLLNNYSGGHF